MPLDLSSLASVRALAQDINTRIANGTLEPIRAGWHPTGDMFPLPADAQTPYKLQHYLNNSSMGNPDATA